MEIYWPLTAANPAEVLGVLSVKTFTHTGLVLRGGRGWGGEGGRRTAPLSLSAVPWPATVYSFRMDSNCPKYEWDSTPMARALTSVVVLCLQGRFMDPTHCKEKSKGKTSDFPWGVWTQKDS